MKTRQDALKLLEEWVKSDSLRRHCRAVGAAMEGYARKFVEEGKVDENDVELWYVCGLLHDFDYERYPDIKKHPIPGCQTLRALEYDEAIIEAILGHNQTATGLPRKSLMAKTLFAVDELCGLVVALAKVRPGDFEGMSPKSVRKVLKKKDFAQAVSREDIVKGMEELGIETDEGRAEHLETVIGALESRKEELGF